MTYTGITEAELNTLRTFAEVLGFELMELNGSLVFTLEISGNVWVRDITKELITLITETEEANGHDAWQNIDLDNAGDDSRCWYPL